MAAATASRPSAASAAKPTNTTGKDIWSQIIVEKLTPSSTNPPPREASLLFLGPHGAGKSTLIQSFMFKDRDEVPKSTSALDYRYTRTSVKDAMSEEKSISHFWELGGGSTLKELMDVAVKEGEGVKDALIVIVVDCERVGMVVEDTIKFIDMARKKGDNLMQQMKANGSNVSRLHPHILSMQSRTTSQLTPIAELTQTFCGVAFACFPMCTGPYSDGVVAEEAIR